MIVIFYLGKQKFDIIAITEKSGYMFIVNMFIVNMFIGY